MDDITLAKRYLQKYSNSQARGIEFTLSFTSYKNLMRAKRCHYTGVELTSEEGKPNQRTIDRIHPDKGYETGNVVACCLEFNRIKGIMEHGRAILLPQFQKAVTTMFIKVNERK